jgi:glycosyltransferase involved in cell wall biosynthesis
MKKEMVKITGLHISNFLASENSENSEMKSKVTFLTATGVYPQSLGGPAIHLYYLHSKLSQLGLASEVFNFGNLKNIKRAFCRFYTAVRYLKTSNVVVFNSPPAGLLLLMSCLSKILGKKIIYILHGGIFFEVNGLLGKSIQIATLFQLRNGLIDYAVVPSRWLANFIHIYKFKSRVIVIPNGVDLQEIDSLNREKIETKKNILFVGRLAKIKGIAELVHAFSLLRDAGYNLYMVGPNEDLDQNQMDRIRNVPGVHLCGKMNHEKVLSLMKGADIVVVPSLMENFPLVVLEAMACGKPIVATNVGGIPEMIEDHCNGILIPPKDANALARAIFFLMENPDQAKRLGQAARRTIEAYFTSDVMAQDYLKILK